MSTEGVPRGEQPAKAPDSQALSLELHMGEALMPEGTLPSGWREAIAPMLDRVGGLYGARVTLGHVTASPYLERQAYAVLVDGLAAGVGTLWPGHALAVPPIDLIGATDLAGFPGLDPVTGYPSWWVRDDEVTHARDRGYWVAEAECVLAGHLEAIACRVLSR